MPLEQSIDHLATAIDKLAAALGDRSAEALAREQKWNKAKDEDFPSQHPDEDPAPPEANTTTKPDPSIKLENVRAKLAKISQAGKQKEVKALLTSFGVKKLSALSPEKFPDLMAKADEIA